MPRTHTLEYNHAKSHYVINRYFALCREFVSYWYPGFPSQIHFQCNPGKSSLSHELNFKWVDTSDLTESCALLHDAILLKGPHEKTHYPFLYDRLSEFLEFSSPFDDADDLPAHIRRISEGCNVIMWERPCISHKGWTTNYFDATFQYMKLDLEMEPDVWHHLSVVDAPLENTNGN